MQHALSSANEGNAMCYLYYRSFNRMLFRRCTIYVGRRCQIEISAQLGREMSSVAWIAARLLGKSMLDGCVDTGVASPEPTGILPNGARSENQCCR